MTDLNNYGYSFDETDTSVCPFKYAPDANSSSANLTWAVYMEVDGTWYVRVQDKGTYGDPPRSNVYFYPESSESVSEMWAWIYDSDGNMTGNYGSGNAVTDAVKYTFDATYYLIPVTYFEDSLTAEGFIFDENNTDDCPFQYAPNANYGSSNLTQASYLKLNGTWYVKVQDTGTYSGSTIPRSNIYYAPTDKVVLSLGNGNGTSNFKDYGTASLRYKTKSLSAYADSNGDVPINLPSDDDLGADFTVVDGSGSLDDIIMTLGRESTSYDYKLVGWINIATGEYYDTSGGKTTATVSMDDNNVFYANWIAATYDKGLSTDDDLRTDVVSTSSFVTLNLFDYNELFNLYTASLEQNGVTSEVWSDGDVLYTTPRLENDTSTLTQSADHGFMFFNTGTAPNNTYLLQNPKGRTSNTSSMWTGSEAVRNAYDLWGIDSRDSDVLKRVFNTSATNNSADDLGVYYAGPAGYLFWLNDEGYYEYDSSISLASYNQTDQRFYVYKGMDNQTAQATGTSMFLPFNKLGDITTSTYESDGTINYWFGTSMEVDFYLPNETGSNANKIGANDMTFSFSGDDDVFIFVDDQLVLDLSGIHSKSTGDLNFSTGEAVINAGSTNYESTTTYAGSNAIAAGKHTLTVYYMERGASASNLKLTFNIIPYWIYSSLSDFQTITAQKTWQYSDGSSVDAADIPMQSVDVGLFEKIVYDDTDYNKSISTDGSGNTTYTYSYTDVDGYETVYSITIDSGGNAVSYTYSYNGAAETYTDTSTNTGYISDNNGYIIAWYDGTNVWVRKDVQVLSSANEWYYGWELYNSDIDYTILELTQTDLFTTETTVDAFDNYGYWSIIGKTEIQGALSTALNSSDTSDRDPIMQILLTDAAQHDVVNSQTNEAYGTLLVGVSTAVDGSGIDVDQIKVSQSSEIETVTNNGTYYIGEYGVTGNNALSALGSGAIWYVAATEKTANDIDGSSLSVFNLYCYLDDSGTKYYLMPYNANDPTDTTEATTLVLTTDVSKVGSFYYDSMGELKVILEENLLQTSNIRRVTIENGEVVVTTATSDYEKEDVKIYAYNEYAGTNGSAYTHHTNILKSVTATKVDSADTTKTLEGAVFTLQNSSGEYYYYYVDSNNNGRLQWSATVVEFTSDADGIIRFPYLPEGTYTLTEVSAPSGYIKGGPYTFTVNEDGDIISVTDASGNDYISVDSTNLSLLFVKNISVYELPEVGSFGIYKITFTGILLMCMSSMILLLFLSLFDERKKGVRGL
ncbi:MAG: prealbumin-like fold domain-containing protein [Clostridiales bacterium]|nr:prealbumin-like fold domain-containing protein [Clostridiales bacterium]